MYKERISTLLREINQQNTDDPELQELMFGLVEDGLGSFVRYVNCVYNMESMITIARFRANDTQEFQQRVQDLDSSRRTAHEAAISSINAIDRLCGRLEVEPVYGGSQDRNDIGDFCGAIVDEYFSGRSRGRSIQKEDIKQVLNESLDLNENSEIEEEIEIDDGMELNR